MRRTGFIVFLMCACNSYEPVDGTPLDGRNAMPAQGGERRKGKSSTTDDGAATTDDTAPVASGSADPGTSPPKPVCTIAEGTYDMPPSTHEATDGTCVILASEWNKTPQGGSFSLTDAGGGVWETRPANAPTSATKWTFNASTCELVRTQQQTTSWQDSQGNPAVVVTTTTSRMRTASTAKLDFEGTTQLTSTTPGATGFPCQLVSRASGTKL